MATKKTFVYKVLAPDEPKWDETTWDSSKWGGGGLKSLVAVWRGEVISDPTFRTLINGGDGEMVVSLARPFDDFGEGVDISLNNTVELEVSDKEDSGKLIYRGFISSYTPTLKGEVQVLVVNVRGYGETLAKHMYKNESGNTTVVQNSKDPSAIFKDILDRFIDDGGELGYIATDIENTGSTVSYTFNTNTFREALDKVVELAPEGWFWRLNPNGMVDFKQKNTNVQHQLSTKKDISLLEPDKNMENVINEVHFIGGDTGGGENLYIVKRDATSIDDYGVRILKIVDGRVTLQATATTIATRVLEERASPERRTGARIIDSNGTGDNGFDIESMKVGDTIQFSELTGAVPTPTLWDTALWGVDVWDNTQFSSARDIMQVVSLIYSPDYLEVEATTRLPEISKRIEDINRNFESTTFSSNPSSPTEV